MSSATTEGPSISTTTMDTFKDENNLDGPVALATPENMTNETTTTDEDVANGSAAPQATTGTTDAVPASIPPTETTAISSNAQLSTEPVVNQTQQQQRLPYKYDPDKITLRFLFANRDGLTVTVTCNPLDTVGEVKGALISIWPKDVPNCNDGDDLRLICMGKGFLSPDSRTLQDCQIPIFKTHPTPINVSVKPSKDVSPENTSTNPTKNKRNQQTINTNNYNNSASNHNTNANGTGNHQTTATSSSSNGPIETGQGCCIIS